jgi:hypothetical protein
MPSFNIVEKLTGNVVFTYCGTEKSKYGRDDWDNEELFEHVLIPDPEPPPATPRKSMSKWQFRSLFTLEERIACDSAPDNTLIPENFRMIIKTMNKDFDAAEEIDPALPNVQQGIVLFEQLGLLSPGRANKILYED